MPSKSVASDETVVPNDDASLPRAKPKRVRDGATKAPRRRPIVLPVLVVDETFLLPHMSIPYPIEDDESAMVIDRSLRMPLRQVLVLTERMVQESLQSEDLPNRSSRRSFPICFTRMKPSSRPTATSRGAGRRSSRTTACNSSSARSASLPKLGSESRLRGAPRT